MSTSSHRPPLRKKLGQHHLRSGELCRPLLDYLMPRGERVIEIGPGGGILTRELVEAGARVVACEVDLAWAFHLRQTLPHPHLSIAAIDALALTWERLPAPTLVAGNLPFNVGTRILESLLPHSTTVPRAAFMVQKEVAERLVATPGSAAYGGLSVLVAAQAEASYLGTVRPGSFVPPPKVAAAFVGLRLRSAPLPPGEMPAFRRLVHLAFGQRRKTLRNALAAEWGREASDAAVTALGLDPRCRAEALPLATFVELYSWRKARKVELGGGNC